MKIAIQRRDHVALVFALTAGVALGVAAGAARAGNEIKVGMMGTAYEPKMVQARVGDVLNFTNDDFENHWVYVPTHGYLVSRGTQKPGEDFKLMLAKDGTFDVLCALHTGMAMKVAVRK